MPDITPNPNNPSLRPTQREADSLDTPPQRSAVRQSRSTPALASNPQQTARIRTSSSTNTMSTLFESPTSARKDVLAPSSQPPQPSPNDLGLEPEGDVERQTAEPFEIEPEGMVDVTERDESVFVRAAKMIPEPFRQKAMDVGSKVANGAIVAGSATADVLTRDIQALSTRNDQWILDQLQSPEGLEFLKTADGQIIKHRRMTDTSPAELVSVSHADLKSDLQNVAKELWAIDNLDPRLRQRFSNYISQSEAALRAFDPAQPNDLTTNKKGTAALTNLLVSAMPWMLGTDAFGNTERADGESRLSKEFLLIASAYQFKVMLSYFSDQFSPVNNTDTSARFLKNKRAYEVQDFVSGAPALFSKSVNAATKDNPAYVLGRAAFAASSLNLLYQSDGLGKLGNKFLTGLQSLLTEGSLKGSTAYPRILAQSESLRQDHTAMMQLNRAGDALINASEQMSDMGRALDLQGKPGSPALAQHVELASRMCLKGAEEIFVATGKDDGPVPVDHAIKAKAMIAAIAGGIFAANVLLVLNDGLATAGVVGDLAFSFPIIALNILDPSVTEQGAKEAFKSYAGTSMIAAEVLGLNAALGDPLNNDESGKSFAAMATAFMALQTFTSTAQVDGLMWLMQKIGEHAGNLMSSEAEDASSDDIADIEMVPFLPAKEDEADRRVALAMSMPSDPRAAARSQAALSGLTMELGDRVSLAASEDPGTKADLKKGENEIL